MRHLTFLLVIAVSFVAPANLLAQAERAAQAGQPAQSKDAPQVSPTPTSANSAAANQTPRDEDFYRFVSNQRWGTHLQVRMKSRTLFHGTRAEVNPGYFVLMHRGRSVFIPYKDVASIKAGKTFWQQVGTVAMWPVKGAMYAVIIPVGLCVLGVSVLIDKIRGKDPWR